MKRYLSLLLIVVNLFMFTLALFAASVTPTTFSGNDSNPNDYTPPEGCIHYEVPNSGNSGTHSIRFNQTGQIDPAGDLVFTVVVGTAPGNDYTEVLSWSSNFPVHAVIVKGGNGFNLYEYGESVRNDTSLVSPVNASGHPADVSHASVVICPGTFPTPTPTTTVTPTPTPTINPTATPTPTSTPCPSNSPCPPKDCCCNIRWFLIVIIILLMLILLAILFIIWFLLKNECKKDDCHKRHYC